MYIHDTDSAVTHCLWGRLRGLTSSAVGHRSIAPGFKTRPGYVRRVFQLSLRLITIGGRSTHLNYLVRTKVAVKRNIYNFTHCL